MKQPLRRLITACTLTAALAAGIAAATDPGTATPQGDTTWNTTAGDTTWGLQTGTAEAVAPADTTW